MAFRIFLIGVLLELARPEVLAKIGEIMDFSGIPIRLGKGKTLRPLIKVLEVEFASSIRLGEQWEKLKNGKRFFSRQLPS